MVNINAKNSEGRTALDIATTVVNPGEAQRKIKEALDHARASKSTSLPEDPVLAKFFTSRRTITEVFIQIWFRQGRELTMEKRNAMLVVASLIATATFQAILSPPGGVRGTGDNNNQLTTNENHINATIMSTTTTNNNNLIPTNNVSYINAIIFTNTSTNTNTTNPTKQVLFKNSKLKAHITYGSFFAFFYFLNTLCFLASVMAMIFLLPLQLISLLLYVPLLFLILSYGASFAVISPSSLYTMLFFLLSYGCAVLIYFMRPVIIETRGKGPQLSYGYAVLLVFLVGHRGIRLQKLLHLLERS